MGKTTTNVGVFLELGLVPLNIYAQKNSIQNWNRIAKFETSNPLVSLSYRNSLLEELAWPLMIKKNLSKCGMMDVFFCEKRANTPQRFLQRLIDIFHQEAFAEINEPSSKLRTYKEFKTEIGLENYLEIISCERDRINLSRLRLSNHQLMIEKGRHQKISKEHVNTSTVISVNIINVHTHTQMVCVVWCVVWCVRGVCAVCVVCVVCGVCGVCVVCGMWCGVWCGVWCMWCGMWCVCGVCIVCMLCVCVLCVCVYVRVCM